MRAKGRSSEPTNQLLRHTLNKKGSAPKMNKSVVQRDVFIMAFNDAFLVIAIGLLVPAAAIWLVKVPKSTSAPMPAH